MPQEEAGSYRSFLLRCWQEARTDTKQSMQWRFVLQDVADAQNQRAFSNLEQLVDFLRNELPGEVEVAKDDQSPES
jgi:hypothetical protein